MVQLKNILIIYPHWPPSNLAGVHRPRLIANFAKDFGWTPIVLTVKPEYYEEEPDFNMQKLVSSNIMVEQVDAYRLTNSLRVVGDLGIRGFLQLYRRAKEIINHRKIDFIWIPIPSFYTALLGRMLYRLKKTPYGIDYIDPWVDGFTNHEKRFSRAWLSNQLGRLLEPIAVKKASLISGVSTPYYQPVLDRNFKEKKVVHVGMPYGFDPADHSIDLDDIFFPWEGQTGVKPFVYAGAFLPKSHLFINILFNSIQQLKEEKRWDESVVLFFLGTGNYPGKSIMHYAEEYGIQKSVVEIRSRYSFLNVVNFLAESNGVIIIGSTEKHYTASKTFQALLSKKPVFAIFHSESSAVSVLRECEAEQYLVAYQEGIPRDVLIAKIKERFCSFINESELWKPNLNNLEKYSAKASAKKLFDAIDICLT